LPRTGQDGHDISPPAVINHAARLAQHLHVPNTHAIRLLPDQSHTPVSIPNHRDDLASQLPRELDSFPFLKPPFKREKRERLFSPLSFCTHALLQRHARDWITPITEAGRPANGANLEGIFRSRRQDVYLHRPEVGEDRVGLPRFGCAVCPITVDRNS
jgi:hypothetical protein